MGGLRSLIHIIMGKPGAGKSTYLAKLANDHIKKGKNVYSNVHMVGCYKISLKDDVYKYLIEDGLVIIDEAGQEFNSRDFKRFTSEMYKFFTMHRHYSLEIVLACQYWDRLDIVIRELCRRISVVKPCLLNPWIIKIKDINCKIDVSEEKQIVEQFSWKLFSTRYYIGSKVWKLFDSFYRDYLPPKEFSKYGSDLVVLPEGKDKLLHQSEETIQL